MNSPRGGECRVCGQTNQDTLETHHIVPQRYGGSDTPENLIDLCGSCHNAIESIYNDRFYHRLQNVIETDSVHTTDDLGHERHPAESSDRNFPDHPLHVTHSDVLIEEVFENDWANKETVARYLTPVTEVVLLEHHGEDYAESVLEDYRPTEEDPTHESIDALDCGYCNRVFLPWEVDECAKHLRITHRIEDPYEEETTVIKTNLMSDGEIERKEVPKSHAESTEPRSIISGMQENPVNPNQGDGKDGEE
jgi:hypothetical protein